eukprot:493073_1
MSHPIIPTGWTIAMMTCGAIGLLVHIAFVVSTIRYYRSEELDSIKGKIFIIACILVYIFNGFACFEWLFLRTDIIFTLNQTICSAIYSSNFMCYFIGKYWLHYLYIYRIYVTFRGSHVQMSKCHLYTFLMIFTLNFCISLSFWSYNVIPSVHDGHWYFNGNVHEICTLFSDNASNSVTVKAAALSIGLEDFIIGSITLFVFLKRFHLITKRVGDDTIDFQLLEFSIKFAVVASFSVISTLFLFTLAIPFYPNLTFILAIDATINSICLFCMLSIGTNTYNYLFYPCHRLGKKYIAYRFTKSQMANNSIMNISTTHRTVQATVHGMNMTKMESVPTQTPGDMEIKPSQTLPKLTSIADKLSNSLGKQKKHSLLKDDLVTNNNDDEAP